MSEPSRQRSASAPGFANACRQLFVLLALVWCQALFASHVAPDLSNSARADVQLDLAHGLVSSHELWTGARKPDLGFSYGPEVPDAVPGAGLSLLTSAVPPAPSANSFHFSPKPLAQRPGAPRAPPDFPHA